MTVPFAFQADGTLRLAGVGITLFTSDSDNPNGELAGNAAGDLCITTEPALYQWSADATPSWVPVGFSGEFVGDASIQFHDTGSNGIFLLEGTTTALSLSPDNTASLNTAATAITLQSDASVSFGTGSGGGPQPRLYQSAINPNGVVAANAVGDLCITTEPRLYQAMAANDASWVPFVTTSATYNFSVSTASPYAGFAQREATIPLLGGASLFGGGVDSITVPMFVYPAGLVVDGVSAGITNIPLSSDGFDMEATVTVVSLDGTEVMNLSYNTVLASNASNGSVSANQFVVSSQTGSDLTFDTGSGQVSTTAGGAYAVMMLVNFGWD